MKKPCKTSKHVFLPENTIYPFTAWEGEGDGDAQSDAGLILTDAGVAFAPSIASKH